MFQIVYVSYYRSIYSICLNSTSSLLHNFLGNIGVIFYRKFPNHYHKTSTSISSGPTLDLLLIDTIQLCGNVYTVDMQPAGPADPAKAEAQWSWLEDQLIHAR